MTADAFQSHNARELAARSERLLRHADRLEEMVAGNRGWRMVERALVASDAARARRLAVRCVRRALQCERLYEIDQRELTSVARSVGLLDTVDVAYEFGRAAARSRS